MSIIQALIGSFSNVLGAVYRVLHSLRFEYSQGDYLTKTLGTPTTSNVWTWSGWVKLNSYTYNNYLFSAGNNTTDEGYIYIHGATKEVRVASRDGGTLNVQRYTQALTQDPGEWIHIVVQGSSNSAEVWINGQQQTSWNTNTTNSTSWSINSAVNHGIGVRVGQSGTGPYLDGQMAEVHFIDGTAYDASYFGATRGGQWVPKEVTGVTYGNNGFYLPFSQPSSTINAFNSITYTGSNSDQGVTVGFQPDFAWIKCKNDTVSHSVWDSVRGADKLLATDTTAGETTLTNTVVTDVDGMTLYGGYSRVNSASNGRTYVAWCGKAGGAPTATNSGGQTPTSGSVMVDGVASTAQLPTADIYPTKMSVNTAAGFSIVQYDGTGTVATVPHGLSQTPECVIVKNTDDGTTNWLVYHADMDAAPEQKRMFLNLTNNKTDSTTPWNDTAPSSSVLTLGTSGYTNGTNQSMIAYCWHSVPGYSKIGSYTGSGVAGNKVTTGFKPAFVMIKSTGTNSWVMIDNKRSPVNYADKILYADSNAGETTGGTTTSVNFLADGFDFGGAGGSVNAGSTTYIYMAFADTSPNLGLDATTNTNNFTVNGGITPDDQLLDSPNLRFASFDPNNKGANVTLSEANFNSVSSSGYSSVITTETIPTGSKIYVEWTCDNPSALNYIGIAESLPTGYVGDAGTGWGVYMPLSTGNLEVWNNGNGTTLSTSGPAAPHIAMMAVDRVNDEIHFGYNGIWHTTTATTTTTPTLPASAPVTGIIPTSTYYIAASPSTSRSVITNLGQDHTFAGTLAPLSSPFTDSDGNGEFYYEPPAGFKALATSY